MSTPTVTFSNGVKMPLVGLGTWQATDDVMREKLTEAILEYGYRLIDTAPFYENEHLIGEVLQKIFADGELKREDIFITTKISWTCLNPARQEACLRESLRRLQLDYVDSLLAHMPAAFDETNTQPEKDVTVEDIWKSMEKLYEQKLTRSIGVSNFNINQIERVLKISQIPIHNTQFELHIYRPEHDLVDFCRKHGIAVTSYGTLASPGRFEYQNNALGFKELPKPLEDETVVRLAKKYGKTPGQILLRYCIERNIGVIPKSTNSDRLRQNIQLFDFHLSEEEEKELEKRPHRIRIFPQEFMIGHPEDPFAGERGAQK